MRDNHLQFHLQQNNPPVPPQAMALEIDPIPIEVRRLRVVNGSKRKRDLAAVQMADELQVLEQAGALTSEVVDSWDATLRRLLASVPETTYRQWLEPLEVAGVDGDSLILTAPEGIRAWAERRYAGLIAEALADGSDYQSVRFVSDGGEG
jgi:hypothetical protein